MRILEEFWYGNVEPTEYDTSSCKEYKKLLELICRNEEKLKATMTNEQKELFEKYTDCVREHQTNTDCLIFQNGFKLGARILWFISFVYRLRNALFHEIIDPLNDEWQVIFKNSYHVLKQVVDQNIWRLKQLKLLPSASQAAAEEDYNREPPPDIDWPTDEEAKFTWFYYEMLKLNKDGARVLLKGKIDFAEHHYETECTVRWNESLSETAIKNASITSVVDSQEKELAAAI